ncbi:serine hydrolase domain-containing protein [Pseudoalteromonas sp. XMcav11-Q]|uniref:serine hydrolase domain-containing protein n=1 Tax=Pseudoalteromonas sp. XMcav11-Q TaxID=3136665 RepID=UPI0032C44079
MLITNLQSSFKFAHLALLTLLLSACGSDITQTSPLIDETELPKEVGIAQDGALKQHLESIRQAYNVPAITAMTVKDGLVYEIASTGYRDIQSLEPVSDNDRWAIGSVAKSMTALLAARLVEQGLITFDTTVIDIFPELKGQIRPEHETITLQNLLSMTSGLKKDIGVKNQQWYDNTKPLTELRYELTKEVLNTAAVKTRSEFWYSNVGYVIAGHMLERVSNQTWEWLIGEEVFGQLGITNYGFGEPSFESAKQPKGHIYENGHWHGVTEEKKLAPKVYGPAGTVNISLPDLAVYFSSVLEGMQGGDNIVSKESYKMLLSPYSKIQDSHSEYAMGWFVKSDKTAFGHDGFTVAFSVSSLLYPSQNSAYFAAVNGDTDNAPKALSQALEVLMKRNSIE